MVKTGLQVRLVYQDSRSSLKAKGERRRAISRGRLTEELCPVQSSLGSRTLPAIAGYLRKSKPFECRSHGPKRGYQAGAHAQLVKASASTRSQ